MPVPTASRPRETAAPEGGPSSSNGPLTREDILATTERVLRRFGPRKTTVVDVAHELGVSHAAVYRHFPSKAALRAAAVRGWLDRPHEELLEIAVSTRLAPRERLRAWLLSLFRTRRAQADDEPELFAAFYELAVEQGEAVREHVADLRRQVAAILRDGQADGSFVPLDHDATEATASTVLDLMTRFQHPAHAHNWTRRGTIEQEFDQACDLILRGLCTERGGRSPGD